MKLKHCNYLRSHFSIIITTCQFVSSPSKVNFFLLYYTRQFDCFYKPFLALIIVYLPKALVDSKKDLVVYRFKRL